jgi:acetyl esterase/lipase
MPAVVTARRITGKSRHSGWSFRDEVVTTWFHFILSTKDYRQWRNLLRINTMVALLRGGRNLTKIDELEISGYWIDDFKSPIPVEEKDIVWFYLHGGGYLSGHPAMYLTSHLKILSELRKKYNIANIRILSVFYPLTPESHYPAQINVAFDAYRWLVKVHKTPAHKIMVGK